MPAGIHNIFVFSFKSLNLMIFPIPLRPHGHDQRGLCGVLVIYTISALMVFSGNL
jgi:hypothetical protein